MHTRINVPSRVWVKALKKSKTGVTTMVLFWLMVLKKGPVVLKAHGIGLAHGIEKKGPVVLKKDKPI